MRMNKRVKRGILLVVSLMLFAGGVWALLCVKNHHELSEEGIYSQDVDGNVVQYDIRRAEGKWKLTVSENMPYTASAEVSVVAGADDLPDVEYWGTGIMKEDGSLYFEEMEGINGYGNFSSMEFTIQFDYGTISGERTVIYVTGDTDSSKFIALKDDAYELDATRTIVVAVVFGVWLIWVIVLSLFYMKWFQMHALLYIGLLTVVGCSLMCAAFYGKDYSGVYLLRGDHEEIVANVTNEDNGKNQVLITIGDKLLVDTETDLYSGQQFTLPSDYAELYTFSEYIDRYPKEVFLQVTTQGISLILKRDDLAVAVPLTSDGIVEPWWMAIAFLAVPLTGGLIVGIVIKNKYSRRGVLNRYRGSYTLGRLVTLPEELEYMTDYVIKNRAGAAVLIDKKTFRLGEVLYEAPSISVLSGRRFAMKYPELTLPKGASVLVIEPQGEKEHSYYVWQQACTMMAERNDAHLTLWEMEVAE